MRYKDKLGGESFDLLDDIMCGIRGRETTLKKHFSDHELYPEYERIWDVVHKIWLLLHEVGEEDIEKMSGLAAMVYDADEDDDYMGLK